MQTHNKTRIAAISLAALSLGVLACLCTSLGLPTLPDAPGLGAPTQFDAGDGLETTGGGTINVGGTASGTLDDIFAAHNWTFAGTAGQTVNITVTGDGTSDPRAYLIDPSGNVLAEDDDSAGNFGAAITATLPSNGTYTIRVDVFSAGAYTVALN